MDVGYNTSLSLMEHLSALRCIHGFFVSTQEESCLGMAFMMY